MLKIKQKKQSGFTVVELIVVITIFAALTSVVLFRFSDFDENIKLQNLAQQIALQIRRAQTAGSQGEVPPVITPSNWVPTYGVYFDTSAPPLQTFTYFVDLNSDGDSGYQLYSGTGNCTQKEECLAEISIATTQEIEKLCVNLKNDNKSIDDCYTVDELHITFTRPSLEAVIKTEDENLTVNDAEIIISSPKLERKRMITVWPIGQISVE